MSESLRPCYDAAEQETLQRLEVQPLAELERTIANAASGGTRFRQAVDGEEDIAVIAEHKRASPSEGEIRPGSSVAWTVEQYQRGGAAALSILTQGAHFGGSIEDLREARKASDLPILRKDFISNAWQLYETKANQADAVLLIAKGLSQKRLKELRTEAANISLDCLVEVHDKYDMAQALEAQADIIGINNRNLSTLEVDISTVEELVGEVPADIPVIAESGYSVQNVEHINQLRQIQVDGVLIGTALMREDNPEEALSNWINYGMQAHNTSPVECLKSTFKRKK